MRFVRISWKLEHWIGRRWKKMARHHSLGKQFFFQVNMKEKLLDNWIEWDEHEFQYITLDGIFSSFCVSLEESGNWSSTRISDSGIDESLCWTSFDKWCTSTFWRKKDSHSHIFKNSKLILSVSNIILMNGWKFLFDLQNLIHNFDYLCNASFCAASFLNPMKTTSTKMLNFVHMHFYFKIDISEEILL